MKISVWLMLASLSAAVPAEAQEAGGGLLNVEPGLVIWTLVVFGLLLFALKRWAWPHVLGAVEARERALEAQIAETERNRAESAALLAEHKKLIADAKGAAHTILADAKAASERERALAVEKTKQEQLELLQRARRDIDAERQRAIADLRREAVDLSLAAASKLVGERLDSDADRRLVTNYLASLEPRG